MIEAMAKSIVITDVKVFGKPGGDGACLSGGRGRRLSVNLRPAWATRGSSRTGSKATEKPCLEKQNKSLWKV